MTLVVRPGHLPGDALFSNVSLLLHGNADGSGNILDSSPSPKTFSKFGQAASATPPSYPNSNSAFGNAIAFDGNGDYLRSPASSEFAFGTGDFTIEFWARKSAAGSIGYDSVISTDLDGYIVNSWTVELSANSGFAFYANGEIRAQYNFNPNDSDWRYYAITRQSGSLRLFTNGTLRTTATYTASISAASSLVVGAGTFGGLIAFNGYIDELRVTKGFARYVEGTGANAGKMVFAGTNTLALPTEAFPDAQY